MVVPGSRLQIIVEIKREHDTPERKEHRLLRLRSNLIPVAVFLVNVRATMLTCGALPALRVRGFAQPVRFSIDLLDEGNGTEKVAPRLARVEESGSNRRNRQSHKKYRNGVAVSVSG